ncbi:MAG TPA: hypothetical protein VES61_00795 [Gaiellaceae bacterium]|nr:hypothetical protein [Gaiellaceae bacterium]
MATVSRRVEVPVERVTAAAYTVPTEAPESDGTLEWDSTTIVVVEVEGGGERGLGYSYADAAGVGLIERRLRALVEGLDVMNIPAAWEAMVAAVRNAGRPGIAATAISAVDVALWDLKARLLELAPSAQALPRGRGRPRARAENTAAVGHGRTFLRRLRRGALSGRPRLPDDRTPGKLRCTRRWQPGDAAGMSTRSSL